jgi:hypothetical protein
VSDVRRCRRAGVGPERMPKKPSSDSADGEARANTADQLRAALQMKMSHLGILPASVRLVSCIRLFDGRAITVSYTTAGRRQHSVSSLYQLECDERTRWATEGLLSAQQLPAFQRRPETEDRGSPGSTLHAHGLTAAPVNLGMDIMVSNTSHEVGGLAIADISDSLPIDAHVNSTPTVREL